MSFQKEILLVELPMRLCGLWPEDRTYVKVKFIFSILLNAVGAIVNFKTLFVSTISNKDFMANMSYALSFTLVVINAFTIKKNSPTIITIIKWMRENWNCYQYLPKKSQVAINRQMIKSRQFMIFVYSMIAMPAIFLFLGPLVEAQLKNTSIANICKEGWFSFHMEKPLYITIISIIRVLASACGGIIWGSIDCFIILLVYHICGQMSVLCHAINDYKECIKHINNKLINCGNGPYYCSCLKCIVHRHDAIIEISKAVEYCVSLIIFTKLIVHGTQISTVGILLVSQETIQISMIPMYMSYFSAIIWTTLIYGWLGEQLTQQGYAIGDSVYANNWYAFRHPKTRQTFSIIICRAQRPIKITAGKYFTMSLNTVVQAIKTSISYLSVLKAVNMSQK